VPCALWLQVPPSGTKIQDVMLPGYYEEWQKSREVRHVAAEWPGWGLLIFLFSVWAA
jgi:hypothetical protein